MLTVESKQMFQRYFAAVAAWLTVKLSWHFSFCGRTSNPSDPAYTAAHIRPLMSGLSNHEVRAAVQRLVSLRRDNPSCRIVSWLWAISCSPSFPRFEQALSSGEDGWRGKDINTDTHLALYWMAPPSQLKAMLGLLISVCTHQGSLLELAFNQAHL